MLLVCGGIGYRYVGAVAAIVDLRGAVKTTDLTSSLAEEDLDLNYQKPGGCFL